MPVAATPGDAVLHNLLVAATRPDATAARPMSAKAELCALVQKLAERILVSVPSSAGGTEVRITLKTPSLEGTDVVIHRLQGELQVRLLPANAEVQALAQQLRSDLQTALVEKFTGSHVSVDIDTAPQGDTDTDGRSRNPYVAEDDTEETQSRWP